MMRLLERARRILAYREPVDMRNGFKGLYALTLQGLGEDPLSGDLFVFINKERSYMKCLLWDRTGLVLMSKRLERGKFSAPLSSALVCELDERQFSLLFDGVKICY